MIIKVCNRCSDSPIWFFKLRDVNSVYNTCNILHPAIFLNFPLIERNSLVLGIWIQMPNNLSRLGSISHTIVVYFRVVDAPMLYKFAICQDFFTKHTFPFQDVIVDWNDGNKIKVGMNI